MGVRLRQIALVGQDIDWSVTTLAALFDVHVAFRDPGIVPQFGGMFNALLGFGRREQQIGGSGGSLEPPVPFS
jgi:hypothetical protein